MVNKIKNTIPLILFFLGLTMFTYGHLSNQSSFTLPGLASISLGIIILELCIITKKERGPNKTIKKLIERMEYTIDNDENNVVAE